MNEIQSQGYGKTGDIGGQPKQTYFTPDGRLIRSMPDIHEYVIRKGKEIQTGIRDANFDKGWLPTKPDKLQLYCPHCDRWHPDPESIDECGKKKKQFNQQWEKKAKKEIGDNGRLEKLESEISEIKTLLKALLEK